MSEFAILAPGCYRREEVTITYDASLRLTTTPESRQWMEEYWQEQLSLARARGARLFDAPLFRLIEAKALPDRTLHITLGDTSYKEYVVTRMPEFAQNHPERELGNPLAVCSVIETSDGYILLDKRQGVDTYEGRYHVIGGFFERHLDMANASTPDPFAALQREIREETGILASDISEQYCLGVSYDLLLPHGDICFLTRLNISLCEVQQERKPEDDEVQRLHTLQVTATSLREFLVHNHGNISPTGEPNLLLYGAWKFGKHWFDEIMILIA